MEDVLIYLGRLKNDLELLFAKYNNGEDVEDILKKLAPILKLYHDSQPE